jgi:uncharacterized protein YbcV (DUF1398 family)
MFTLQQINASHAQVKSGADFPRHVQNLKQLGLVSYDHYVADGHNEFFGTGSFTLASGPTGPVLVVAAQGNAAALKSALALHQQGGSDYPTFCRQAAEAGVEKWTTHLGPMTCTYYDQQGQPLIVETIPQP